MLVDVTPSEARDFIRTWHYSGSATPGVLRYGWEVDGILMGVSIYDNGNHAMRAGVFGPEYYTHVLHHHRLALSPTTKHGEASEFLAACLRRIRIDRPETWAVVTYADTCQGHYGTIYQATNAIYTGLRAKGNLKFLRPDGKLVSTQSLDWAGTWPERRAVAKEQGWIEKRCLGKHRYVYLLGTKKQRRSRPSLLWPTLPYPKGLL